MNKSEKLKLLQKLSEKDLTMKFLIPLYESNGMGCKNVRYTHRKLVLRFIKVSAYVIVIASDSEAILSLLQTRDCFVAFTPRNDNFYVYILLKRYTSPYPSVIFLLREVKLVEMPEFTG